MFRKALLKVTFLAIVLPNAVAALGCVGREAGQFIEDTSFEVAESFGWDSHGTVRGTTPTYPAHSGNRMMVMTASYSKTANGEEINNYAWVQQFVYLARTANTYRIKAHYNVLSHSKGGSCPDTSLPLTSCKLKIYYVDQVMALIDLHPTSGYVVFDTDFMPESGGRYFNFNLECKPTPSTPGCGEATVLLDDVTWTDPGHVCWTPLGCHTDTVSNRALPHHGRLANWPRTTTIDNCQEACGNQGYKLAGLEFGSECFCGDALIGSSPAPAADCNMRCSGYSLQLCGGPNRLDVYQKP